MLYEVITLFGDAAGLVQAVEQRRLVGGQFGVDVIEVDQAAEDGTVQVGRITSYNVCYTKLLRNDRALRNVTSGLGGYVNGVVREAGFV